MGWFNSILDDYTWLIGLLALLGLEVAPIKFNPITIVGSLLGRVLGISKIDERLDRLERNVDANELDRIKYEILQFSGSLRNGLNRSEVDYQHIEAVFTKYKNMGGNTYIMHEMEYIRDCHDKGRIL